jgi:hypothetical protein
VPLIPCKECQQTVAANAFVCPHCGTRLRRSFMARLGLAVLGAIAGVFLIGWVAEHVMPRSATSEAIPSRRPATVPTTATAVASSSATPALVVSAATLVRDYHDNEVSADGEYRGRAILVDGMIDKIAKDFRDQPSVYFAVPGAFLGVRASLSKTGETQIAAYHRSDRVTLRCIGAQMVMNMPALDNCVVSPMEGTVPAGRTRYQKSGRGAADEPTHIVLHALDGDRVAFLFSSDVMSVVDTVSSSHNGILRAQYGPGCQLLLYVAADSLIAEFQRDATGTACGYSPNEGVYYRARDARP